MENRWLCFLLDGPSVFDGKIQVTVGLPGEGMINPAGITVGMLNIKPAPLGLQTFKRHTLLGPKYNREISTRT